IQRLVTKHGLQQVSGQGSLHGYLQIFFRTNDVRVGTLVGEDKNGNKYYEDSKQKSPIARTFIWTNHKFSMSGTPQQYIPYSTTRKKIQEWVPPLIPY
ncbi:hypothetical protein DBR06_SOUSAS110476, partial [Sousa chinensis]